MRWKQFTYDDIFTTNGSLFIRSAITLTDADEFTSQDTGAILDPSGNLILNIGGLTRGKRMTIE